MNRLDGKVALLSGAARGIGGQAARRMAEAGAKIIIGDVLEEPGKELAKEITDAGGEAQFVRLDVTQEADWDAAVKVATDAMAALTYLSTMLVCFSDAILKKSVLTTGTDWFLSTSPVCFLAPSIVRRRCVTQQRTPHMAARL